MSKLIRPTIVRRPGPRRPKRPIYVIASGGDVFVATWVGKTLTWAEATEADFGAQAATSANQPIFDNTDKR